MKVVFDIEANALVNPDQIWLIICKDISTGDKHIFRNVTLDATELSRFSEFSSSVTQWIGHNALGYDCLVVEDLLGIRLHEKTLDTLILSKLIDYPRSGHSVEHYGEEFGYSKGTFSRWNDPELRDVNSELYKKLEEYCLRDVEITHKIYLKYLRYLSKKEHLPSIDLEHSFQGIVNSLTKNGFAFNDKKAKELLSRVTEELSTLDTSIAKEFPSKLKLIREVTPKATKYGTISLSSIPKVLRNSISEMTVDAPFCFCSWEEFNPSSHKQLIRVLNEAGWKPTDKTQTHIDTERELRNLSRSKHRDNALDVAIQECHNKLSSLESTGYKINETNLATLPDDAPAPVRTLARRILLESRRRTLTEWLDLVQPDGRIHGKFYGIGAWTHRMAHQKPNTANIPNEFDTQDNVKLLGKEMRQLWRAPKGRLLAGVDAEGIQLRIFAHYIDDPEFTDALVRGKKADKTDPHSLNQRILGRVCKSRAAAKRFIYALLLGAGLQKLSQILECSDAETTAALDRLMERYTGWATLKEDIFPKDAQRGYLIGLDGRRVRIPGETVGNRKHLCMSGYLQNGEAIVVKKAAVAAEPLLKELHESIMFVDIVHDEYILETPNDVIMAEKAVQILEESIANVGVALNLKCPLKGDGSVGLNWYEIH